MIKLEDISLDHIYDFIENGDVTDADPSIVAYLELMDKVKGMHLRFDRFGSKEHILKHLMKAEGFSRYVATNLYNNTLEYFYCDTKISKDAWRNIYADKMERVINLAMMTIKDVADAAKVTKMIKELGEMRMLHVEDKEELPEEFFLKQFKLYATDATFFGMENADRVAIAKQVDKLPELTEKEKILIKQEAGVLPLTMFLDEQEDPRKS